MKLLYRIIIMCLLFNSCKNYGKREYYPTGELEYEVYGVNDSISYGIEYYINGKKKSEGYILHDSIPNGEWQEYYSDGVLRWKGRYEYGHIVFGTDKEIDSWKNKAVSLDLDKEEQMYELYDTCYFRLRIDGVHPDWYRVCVAAINSKPNIERVIESKNIEDVFQYKLVIQPKFIQYNDRGVPFIEVVIFFMKNDGSLWIGGSNCRSLIILLDGIEGTPTINADSQ